MHVLYWDWSKKKSEKKKASKTDPPLKWLSFLADITNLFAFSLNILIYSAITSYYGNNVYNLKYGLWTVFQVEFIATVQHKKNSASFMVLNLYFESMQTCKPRKLW